MEGIAQTDFETILETMESQTLTPENQSMPQLQTTNSSRAKRTAAIWKHYHFIDKRVESKKDNVVESRLVPYAICNYCGKEYKAETYMGTSNPTKHIEVCPQLQHSDITIVASSFDQKTFLRMYARAIICHAYSFSIVEHEHTRVMLTYLNPKVKHVTRNTILKYCIQEHATYKAMVHETLQNVAGKISFTCDLWTACTSCGYLTLTGHYVDNDWNLRSKVLNFRYCEPPHSGVDVSKFVLNLIKEWNLEGKVFSMTVDNARSMDVMVSNLKKELMPYSSIPCEGAFFHVRCCAHILNLIVQRGLKYVDVSVTKLRDIVKYIDGSDTRLCQFEQAVRDVDSAFKGKLRLDVVTRWNATYKMIQKALEAKDALVHYGEKYLGIAYRLDALEWETLQTVCDFLQPFFDITVLFSGSEYPTANLYFENVVTIERNLNEAHNDPKLIGMASEMFKKFEDYWESYSLILSIAVVLDPRYKLQYVKKLFGLLYVGEEVRERVKNSPYTLIN